MVSCEALPQYLKVLNVAKTNPIYGAFLLGLVVVICVKQAVGDSATRFRFLTDSQLQESNFFDLPHRQLNAQALANVLFPKSASIYWHDPDYSTFTTSNSRTSTKWPAIAAAAAITGLTRCVRLSRPWRPSKLRLEVLALRSCGGKTSAFMPMHMLQPASRHSKPAARKILSRPSFSAWALIPREPGTTRACLMLFATCLPATSCAAARRSSRRELVQEPMNTRSTGMSTMGVPALSPMYFSALSVAF